jgi:hypothetical protein
MERGADARLTTWKRLFESLGYEALFLPIFYNDDTQEWLERGRAERTDRMDRGRTRRR